VSVLRSNFNLGNAIINPIYKNSTKKGVHMLNSTGFRVEENSFTGSLPNATGLYGVVVENSGRNNNEIYKNKFDRLTIGQQFIGINRNGTIFGGGITGLKSLCNIHTNIAVKDIDVIPHLSDDEIYPNSGIAHYQDGYNTAIQLNKAAGNSFSTTATINYSNNNKAVFLIPQHIIQTQGYYATS
jgi:hypothetical protein